MIIIKDFLKQIVFSIRFLFILLMFHHTQMYYSMSHHLHFVEKLGRVSVAQSSCCVRVLMSLRGESGCALRSVAATARATYGPGHTLESRLSAH